MPKMLGQADYTLSSSSASYHLIPDHDPDFEDDRWLDSMIEDRKGMRVTSGVVTIKKNPKNMIGISIGGGAPHCPCIYVVQIFDQTPAASDGTLESGDEIVGVNGESVKGKTKIEVAKMIQASEPEVTFNYNKLHAEPKQGKSLDIVLKKVKHRIVENMGSDTADALGLSRAMLCNDSFIRKLEELELMELMYKGLIERTKDLLKAHLGMCHVMKAFGDVFSEIGVRDPHPDSSKAFAAFGQAHRIIERKGMQMIRDLKPLVSDLSTFLNKVMPDMKLTIKKYADVKFEYLSYCLKVREMDDEEFETNSQDDPLYRVETGNYEYRLVLRCRQQARARFAQKRSDVLVKLELMDQRHVQDVVEKLQKLLSNLAELHAESYSLINENKSFPVELDLSQDCQGNNTDNSDMRDDEKTSESTDQEEIELPESLPSDQLLTIDKQ
ncbi:PRKCA-binding protein-like [Brevipalpus obovatus]|uniref:PRKCA-binding protein-like n=1 Tax=Brevipalpus obovatus TaxID=246614 RepID=UPI003D9FAE3A